MKIIDDIYNDLDTIITFAKLINYRFLLYGDLNARIGLLIGDHSTNPNGIDKFLPFINRHNLRIINQHGVYTCIDDKGKSIVDYLITDTHPFWDTIYKINLQCLNIKFKCKEKKWSDHKPLLIQLTSDLNKLHSTVLNPFTFETNINYTFEPIYI